MVSVNDFSLICRICLQPHDNMVDIFGSGIDNQLMEITKLKVKSDDKLPKMLCQNCKNQMEYFSEFQEKAKLSDIFLKSLLSNNECEEINGRKSPVLKAQRAKPNKKLKKFVSKKIKYKKKLNIKKENNDLYLIVVPQQDDSGIKNKIYIKNLNISSDDLELTDYCKNLVKDYFVDQSDIETNKNFDENSDVEKNKVMNKLINCDNKLNCSNVRHLVNLFIYNCKKCEKSFDEYCDLSTHYLFVHNSGAPLMQQFSYKCDSCNYLETDKKNYLTHLEKHQKENSQSFSIHSKGKNSIPINISEKSISSASDINEKILKPHKIINLNLDILICAICFEKIESKNFISEHFNLFHKDIFIKNFYIKYICPICNALFINEKNMFVEHLILHKINNFFFIKINSKGEPLKLNDEEDIFINYNEAVEIINVINKTNSLFTVVDIFSCEKCNHSANSLQSLNEHYLMVHLEVGEKHHNSLICPACSTEFKPGANCNIKDQFYEHLRVHKNEGLKFIEVGKTGFIKPSVDGYTDIFSQSKILYGLSTGLLTIDLNQAYYPDCEIFSSEISIEKDLKDKKNYKAKRKVSYFKPQQDKSLHYVCEKCGKVFAGKLNYKKHSLTHLSASELHRKKPECAVCHKAFSNRTTLFSHLKSHIQEGEKNGKSESLVGEFVCDQCGKSFSNHTSLTKHKKTHTAEKENSFLKCEICDRKFLWQTSYLRHKSAHLNPKYLDCDVCKLPLPSAASLQKHIQTHKSGNTFDCKVCKTSFLTKESLTAHQAHTGHHQDRKPLECNVCHEKFFIGRKFTEHIKTHPKYKMEECTLCGKRLSTVQSLMLHMSRHFESNSILCPHCGKQFFEERNYHRHLLTHEGIKPFGCDIMGCEKSFYTLFELNRHKKYHSNTRDFVCAYCGKSFHEANHLTVHVRTHTGERPYVCPHCHKGFITRTRCKHHIKLVHQGVGYDLIQSTISKKVTVFETVEAFI